ncbi:RNA polymerase recycling motor HelD [Pediococcus claussenii]|uniref:UvrD/REP helicase family protein n=1 Tax=Pediococcus claussenii (strain ATCC BAA-344 / DSM 14800 / JCM 18046 / KCTC 3811 / LMG 21948 / P06) TaxID=701521 RepID=G8PEE6_PEDCP|nr:RNA polymerase recycling motor HelD [Pediococcus claussenii]AEV94407.1 uvrD/REP helicase family protein [Pediococcus claussenii ATCC BAA-344]ANZ69628.1 ATP-dependent DNA helicase [Pediococcus claussenii]ANZ71445.1 ATP-dependent DNA helicase [Pediococcus claussenii]KRN19889.1 hypothetical protein IV79_GL001178 [Pediococcus claussenii]
MEEEQAKEQKRVDEVIDKIEKQKQHTQDLYDKAHTETSSVEKNYVQNAKVNLIEADDRIETNAEIQQQKGLVARAVENETILQRQINDLENLKKSPYFGRIDIQDPDEPVSESLYIGISSFADQSGDFLVYDWRAPISSIYYNGTLGPVQYSTPAGTMQTDLKKKRQFNIQNGEIVHMFDTNETVGDEMLQEALGEQNDEYMRNIVATIQKDQNDIIRDTRSDLLVVQGVAGSGKTSAILQRIAFLLYHSRTSLNADEIVLFSPNKLYSRYISDVLPSLGERNMRQLTLAEFFSRRFEGMHVESLFDRYEKQVSLTSEQQALQDWLEGEDFMHLLEQYTLNLNANNIKFTDINLDGTVFFKKEDIQNIFESFPTSMRVSERVLRTKNQLIKKLKQRIKLEIQKDWVQERLEDVNEENYHDIVGKRHFKSFEEEKNFIGASIVQKKFQVIDDAIFNNYFIDIYSQYISFMNSLDVSVNISNAWRHHIDEFSKQLELHQISLLNATPLLFLRDLITGGGGNRKFQHVFIDEMQDYSVAQLMYLKHAFSKAKFTLLGDSEQSLFKDITDPNELLKKLKSAFDVRRARLITLNRSYRSTAPITNFAAALIPDGQKIEAFNRQGDLPKIILTNSPRVMSADLQQLCHEELKAFGTVAVLTKDMAESEQVFNILQSSLHPTLMTDGDRSLPKGVVIMPIYLAKGLEFDSVIGFNVSQENYPTELWRGTLYTIASRAMHHLTLISQGNVSPLITHLDTNLFGMQTSILPK